MSGDAICKFYFALSFSVLAAGCVSTERLDTHVKQVISEKSLTLGGIATNSVEDAFRPVTGRPDKTAPIELDLGNALRLAERYSRALQSQRDQLYSAGLASLAERRKFGVQYSGTLSYLLNKSGDLASTSTGAMNFNASKLLSTGGKMTATAGSAARSLGGATTAGNSLAYDHSASVELHQPLLAGAGYAVSHESLIQAERTLVYNLRTFVQQRQDFAIKTISSYFKLLSARTVVDNTVQSSTQSEFLRKRSEALFKVSLGTALDVMRAKQGELAARNEVVSVQAGYDAQVRRFLIELGLSCDTPVTVVGTIPDVKPVDTTNIAYYVNLALVRRLDLASKRDAVDDAKRKLAIAKDNLRLNVDLFGKAGVSDSGADSLTGGTYVNSSSAGITVDLPLDRRAERDALKTAMMAAAQAERELDEYADTVKVEIEENLRNLDTQARNVLIQKEATTIAKRKYEHSLMQFKAGTLPNRDVVEAQNELLSARNSHVNALVAYELQRLTMLRNVGLLDVAGDGRMIELEPGT